MSPAHDAGRCFEELDDRDELIKNVRLPLGAMCPEASNVGMPAGRQQAQAYGCAKVQAMSRDWLARFCSIPRDSVTDLVHGLRTVQTCFRSTMCGLVSGDDRSPSLGNSVHDAAIFRRERD